MVHRPKVSVLLKGGLGNQLFQIAAGLYSCSENRLQILENFTLPRQTNGVADALYFTWPQGIEINKTYSNRLERKILALNLNLSLTERNFLGSRVLIRLIGLLSDLLFTVRFRELTHVVRGRGVGYSTFSLKRSNNLLNGYFQAHQFPFAPNVSSKMRDIRPKESSPILLEWIQKAKRENPIVVHLRLGDYKYENKIGVLSADYYKKALKIIETSEKSKNIWIFTDEAALIDEFISPPIEYTVNVIAEIGLTPAETLELMRYGSAYVIANSTFSWWAAFLSYQTECTRIMPSPWFQNMPSPVGIRPQDWIEIEFNRN
jgi:hypothetical protein